MNTFENIAAWSSILGAVLGIPSIIFSLLAFREAARAKSAAQRTEEKVAEVRSAFRSLTAAEELQYLSLRASELLLLIEAEKYETGHYVARELRFEINRAIRHWDFLEPDSKLHLKDTSNQLKTITDFLRGRAELTADQRKSLLAQCDETKNTLRSETGRIQALIERR